MPDLVVVDTDVLIDAGRGSGDAIECLSQIEERPALAASVITHMELIVGCRNRAELRALERFLLRFQIVKLDEQM